MCFDDTEEFIQFYFDKKYKEENALVYWDEQGAAIAALQTLLYPSVGPGPGRDDEVTAGGFLRDERKKDSREYSDSG